MAVAVDSIVSNVISDSVTSQNLTTLTVGSGSNRALVAILTLQQSAPSGVTVVWDSGGTNQSMTLIGTVSDTQITAKLYMYGLVAPTSGNKTLRASWTGTSDVTLAAGSFTGVNQTGSTTTFANFTTATGLNATTASANVTSATGNYAIGGWETFAAFNTVSATQWFIDDVATNFSSAASYTTGSTTVTFSETALQIEPYGFAGFSLVAAGATTGITTEAGIVTGLRPSIPFYKAAAASIFNGGPVAVGLIGTGYPAVFAPATPGLAGATIDGTTSTLGGTLPFINPSTQNSYLAKVQTLCNANTFSVGIIDLLWYNTGISSTTTTAQTVSSVTLPARDVAGSTNGAGITAWLYVSVATTNVSANTGITLSYTDQGGTAGNTATIGLAGLPATAVAGNFIPFNLAVGDTGIRSIQSVTLGTSLVTGTVNLILGRHLGLFSVPAASSGWLSDWALTGFPQLYNGTALTFYAIQSAALAVIISGQINIAQG